MKDIKMEITKLLTRSLMALSLITTPSLSSKSKALDEKIIKTNQFRITENTEEIIDLGSKEPLKKDWDLESIKIRDLLNDGLKEAKAAIFIIDRADRINDTLFIVHTIAPNLEKIGIVASDAIHEYHTLDQQKNILFVKINNDID